MSKTRVGIINVTGYAGSELARILHRHPEVQIAQVTGRSAAGKQLSEVFPHLLDADMTISPRDRHVSRCGLLRAAARC